MPEVADIFRRYGGEYLDRFGDAILPSHRRAFQDILHCRTPTLGGHVYRCDRCRREHYAYHSCRNRSCPKCHGRDTEIWLTRRRRELLPVPYFHVVFTLPNQLRDLLRRHQRVLYGVLMKAAAKALIKLAADPHYVGGLIGAMCILHTWTRTLVYHPHVHCLVPAGSLSADGQWLDARKNYLVPIKALSKLFRGIFLDMAAKAMGGLTLPQSIYQQPWVVYCKPSIQDADHVLTYLGRYVHRVAITNHRILSIDNGRIIFRYRNCRDSQSRTMTLPANEFIRRFLQHVLPKGVHKIRYYGLWAPSNQRILRRIQVELGPCESTEPANEGFLPTEPTFAAPRLEGSTCPYCRKGTLVYLRRVGPQRRAPP